MCPDFTAETVTLAETDSFEAIAAALERLAAVVAQCLRPAPPPPAFDRERTPVRRQAA